MPRVGVLTLGDDGEPEIVEVDVDAEGASLAGSYWQAGYRDYLASGDVEHLAPFRGMAIGGHRVLTDPGLIEQFDRDHGSVDFLEYYLG